LASWYYSDGSVQKGPVDLATLRGMIASGSLASSVLVWRAGLPSWCPADQVPELRVARSGGDAIFSTVSAGLNSITDTDKVSVAHVGGLFSQVMKPHTAEETEEVFATGLRVTASQRAQMEFQSPTPWVFSRMLLFFGTAFVALWFSWTEFKAINVLPGVILVGSFAFPLAAAVFFFECNAAKDISLFVFSRLFVWGGVLSILLALALFKLTESLEASMGASVAAIAEEPAKLAAVVILTRSMFYRWTTNGICLGAAVGAGFAAFESAGYAMQVLLASGGSTDAMLDNIVDRGVLAPFAHVVWTAIAAGALWRVKGARPFEWSMVFERRCLAPLLAVMCLHGIWNSSLPARLPALSGYFLLGVVGWTIAIGLLLGGLRELKEAHASAGPQGVGADA